MKNTTLFYLEILVALVLIASMFLAVFMVNETAIQYYNDPIGSYEEDAGVICNCWKYTDEQITNFSVNLNPRMVYNKHDSNNNNSNVSSP